MSNFTQAADDIRTMANRYRNIIQLADALEDLGSIEQATKEAVATRNKAQADRDRVMQQGMEEAEKVAQELAAAQAKAKQILADADEKASAKADELVAAAHAEAERVTSAANQTAIDTMARLGVQRSDMDNAIAVLTDHKNALNNDVNELKQSVGELQGVKFALDAEIATLKAKFA